jgi:protein SCO1/2
MRTKIALGLAGVLLAGGLASCSSSSSSGPIAEFGGTGSANGLLGDELTPATNEPALTLAEGTGGTYRLLPKTAGKVTLVYFGYTHCPDICPTFMADIAEAIRQSTPTVQAKVAVVFISVDPKRDSAVVIKKWLSHFSPNFIGLRGPITQIIAAQKELGVPSSKVLPHSKNGYTVEHSAELLAFTPDRKAHVVYTDGPSTISDLKHDLAILTTDKAYGA